MRNLRSRFLANKLLIYSIILGLFGLLDSLYLTINHYQNIVPPCSLRGCDTVLTGAYSMIGPFPIALLGIIFYLTVIITGLLIIIEGMKKLLGFFHFTVIFGFLFSLLLFFIQFAILKSFCQYCLLSEIISAGLFILSYLKYREDKRV